MQDGMAGLEHSRRAYLAQLRSVVERHLAEISAAEQVSLDGRMNGAPISPVRGASLVKE